MAIIKVPFMSFERGAVVFAASASMSPRSRRTRACVCAPKRSRLRARARAYINQPAAEDGLFGVQSPALMFMLATARAKCSLPIKKPVIRLIEARKRGPRSCGSHFGCAIVFFFLGRRGHREPGCNNRRAGEHFCPPAVSLVNKTARCPS